jgi:hypothetical protein
MTSTVRIANVMDLIAQKTRIKRLLPRSWLRMDEHLVARPQNSLREFRIYGAFSGVRMIHWVARKLMVRGGEKWTFSHDGRAPTRPPPRRSIRAH